MNTDIMGWGSVGADDVADAVPENELFGTLGAEHTLVLNGNMYGHMARANLSWSGETDIYGEDLGAIFDGDELYGEDLFGDDIYGISWFKKASRSLKKAGKAVGKGTATVAKAIAKNKTLVSIGGAALLAFPPTAPLGAVITTAVLTAKIAEQAVPKNVSRAIKEKLLRRKSNARKVVVNTALAAKSGNVSAKRALKVYKTTIKAQKKAKKAGRKLAWIVAKTGLVHRVS
jgi:hypothetical protein